MLKDPRASTLATEFADAWLSLSAKAANASSAFKEPSLFSNYSEQTANQSIEGLRLFVQDALMGDGGGLPKLLTSRSVWATSATANLYDTQTDAKQLERAELNGDRRQGLLTQPALLAMLANREKHAPVRRGMLVLEHLLCQRPPPPPANVTAQNPDVTPQKRTTRQRLIVEHEGQGGACKSCHQIIDGVGFAFEHYNAIGAWQDTDEGMPVDSSASIKGTFDADGEFSGALTLSEKLASSEQAHQCFVEHFLKYAQSRPLSELDDCALASLTEQFIRAKGSFNALVMGVVSGKSFRYRSAFSQ